MGRYLPDLTRVIAVSGCDHTQPICAPQPGHNKLLRLQTTFIWYSSKRLNVHQLGRDNLFEPRRSQSAEASRRKYGRAPNVRLGEIKVKASPATIWSRH